MRHSQWRLPETVGPDKHLPSLDIRLSEEIAAVTHTDDFNKSLEIQQSKSSNL